MLLLVSNLSCMCGNSCVDCYPCAFRMPHKHINIHKYSHLQGATSIGAGAGFFGPGLCGNSPTCGKGNIVGQYLIGGVPDISEDLDFLGVLNALLECKSAST